jgi:pyrroloquinoline quinone biosynthesis protein B
MRGAPLAMLLAVFAVAGPPESPQQTRPRAPDWRLVVLGIAQDAGIPQLGCAKGRCAEIHAGRRPRERVTSLGLVDRASGKAFLVDATPDFVSQVHTLTGGRVPDAILLTHAHIGHYTGLMYLGRESVAARGVRVLASARMCRFLRENGPWRQLVSLGNVALQELVADRAQEIAEGLRVTALPVPHRDELSDTVGYLIEGPRRKALFIPDIDGWERWDRPIRELVDRVDVALLDGTFASADELGAGRRIEEVPHPLMPRTRELLAGTRARLVFLHVNHTNAEIDAADVARDGLELEL